MAAISNNKYDVLVWMNKLLFSCDTIDQVFSIKKLINNYKNIYPHQNKDLLTRFSMRVDIKINQLKKNKNI